MKRFFRVTFYLFLTCIVLLSATGFVITKFYATELKKLFFEKLTESLAADISLNGESSFSLWDDFPYASVSLTDIEVVKDQKQILRAGKLSLVFNVIDLYHKNYVIKRIGLEDAELDLLIDKKGNKNFLIWNTDSLRNKDFNIKLQDVNLHNTRIHYLNLQTRQEYDLELRNGKFKGDLSRDHYDLWIRSELKVLKAKIRDRQFLLGHQLKMDLHLDIDLPSHRYTFSSGELNISGNFFEIQGFVADKPAETEMSIQVKGKNLEVGSILKLLPFESSNFMGELESDGALSFLCTIQGMASATQSPDLNIHLEMESGLLKHPILDDPVEEVSFSGTYQSNALELHDFKGILSGHAFEASFKMPDLTKQIWTMQFEGPIQLDLISLKGNLDMGGKVNLEAGQIKGRLNPKNKSLELQLTGNLSLQDVFIGGPRIKIRGLSGQMVLKPGSVQCKDCSFKIGQSDLLLNGELDDLVNYITDQIQDKVLIKRKLRYNGSIRSEKLNVKDLLFKSETADGSSQKSLASFLNGIRGIWEIQVKEFNYLDLKARHVLANINFQGKQVVVQQLELEAMEGKINSNGVILILPQEGLKYETELVCTDINIQELFRQCRNFGQETIMDRHLRGVLTARADVSLSWDKNFKLIQNSIFVKADLLIENGQLVQFKPLEGLSRFVRLSELKDIRFERLANQVRIEKEMIYIPKMEIQNSAMNLTIMGSHSFKNELNYKLRIKLRELLAKKARKKNKEFEEEEGDAVNLFLSMTGTADNPIVKYDKGRVVKSIAEGFKRNKEELFKAVREEFGGKTEPNAIKDWEEADEEEFIEWDDDEKSDDDTPAI